MAVAGILVAHRPESVCLCGEETVDRRVDTAVDNFVDYAVENGELVLWRWHVETTWAVASPVRRLRFTPVSRETIAGPQQRSHSLRSLPPNPPLPVNLGGKYAEYVGLLHGATALPVVFRWLHVTLRTNDLTWRTAMPFHCGAGPPRRAVTNHSQAVDNYVYNVCGETCGYCPRSPDGADDGEPPLILFVKRGAVISPTFTAQLYQWDGR